MYTYNEGKIGLGLGRKKALREKGYWSSIENRRQFFCEYAKDRGFDPTKPENWNSVTQADIRANKVCCELAASPPPPPQQSISIIKSYSVLYKTGERSVGSIR